MLFTLKNKKLILLLPLALTLASCSSTPLLGSAPEVVKEAVIPQLSSELKTEPLSSGSYWAHVTKWRQTWGETLKTLEPK